MPVFDVGYREWRGKRDPAWQRFAVIATTGMRLAWKNQWLRRMMFLAWLPAIYFGIMFFAFERAMQESAGERLVRTAVSAWPPGRAFENQIFASGEVERRPVWAFLLMTLFRYPQGMLMVMLVGLIAPPLISRDLRTRSHLLYFSRPLGMLEYLFGKAAIVAGYLFLVSTLPAVTLYILGVMLSPNLDVVWDTWDLPLRILIASFVLVIPTTAIALCFSSLTEDSRYASFGWFAMWVIGWVAYANLTLIDVGSMGNPQLGQPSRWAFVSLYHTLGELQTVIFGFHVASDRIWTASVILTAATLISLLIICRRLWVLQRK